MNTLSIGQKLYQVMAKKLLKKEHGIAPVRQVQVKPSGYSFKPVYPRVGVVRG